MAEASLIGVDLATGGTYTIRMPELYNDPSARLRRCLASWKRDAICPVCKQVACTSSDNRLACTECGHTVHELVYVTQAREAFQHQHNQPE